MSGERKCIDGPKVSKSYAAFLFYEGKMTARWSEMVRLMLDSWSIVVESVASTVCCIQHMYENYFCDTPA